MSDGYAPRSSPSGEMMAYAKSHWDTLAKIVGICVVLVGMITYIDRKAPAADVIALSKGTTAALAAAKETTSKRIDSRIARAMVAHSAVNAHHGVPGMIVRFAPSKVEFLLLKARVDQMERRGRERHKEIKDDFKEIKGTLKDMSKRLLRLPRLPSRIHSGKAPQ